MTITIEIDTDPENMTDTKDIPTEIIETMIDTGMGTSMTDIGTMTKQGMNTKKIEINTTKKSNKTLKQEIMSLAALGDAAQTNPYS